MSFAAVVGDYPRTYRAALWVYLLAIPVGVAFCALGLALLYLLGGQMRTPGALAGLAAAATGIAAFGGWMLLGVLRSKVVLSEEGVTMQGPLRVRRMARADIAGRRTLSLQYGQKVLVLSSKTPGVRELKISMSGMRRDALWDAWFGALPDLDVEEARALEAEVAANPELGQTPEERLGRLAAAKKTANVLNMATYGAAAWAYIYPRPYDLAILVLAALPWLAIVLVAKSSGLFRIDSRRGEPRPTVAVAILTPGFVLLLRALRDVAVLDLERALIFAALTAALLTWAALMSDATLRAQRLQALLLLTLGCAYGYGTVVLANRELDFGAGEQYRVEVLARHVSRGSRSTTYHLLLDRWGPRADPDDVSVTRDLYELAEPGTRVCVHRGPGAFGIPWFGVAWCGG